MKQAVLVGLPQYIPLAYPEEVRNEIGKMVTLLPGSFQGAEWKERGSDLAEAEFLLATWGMPVLDRAFLEAAPRLRAVFYAAGSVKGFATPESYARGILISSAWEANAVPVAEYSLSTILLGLKGFWLTQRQMRGGSFSHDRSPVAGAYRTKVGLVSLGAIGRRVAAHLSRFEVNVIAYDPFADPVKSAELGVTLVSLGELFAQSDVVSIHAPWLPETEKMINGALLSSMKSGACLINTSRGAVIDEEDLCRVLGERADLTAVLDVTHPEPPLPDSPLRTLENVILTPHIAGSMGGEISRMGRWMVDELSRQLDGKELHHLIPQDMLSRMA
jgi:phosphoglycerate dehydrogenase-like enzyme